MTKIKNTKPNQTIFVVKVIFRVLYPGFRDASLRNDEKRIPEAGKSQFLRNLYVDQQTGEMRLSTTDRAIHHELDGEAESNQIRR